MFPVDKKGERYHDPLSPKIAVYSAHPTAKPTMKVSEVKPAPGSTQRSRLKLLQDQKKLPTGEWTSSTIHTPSSQAYLAATLPPSGGGAGTVADSNTNAGGQVPPRTVEQNYKEQIWLLENQVSQQKSALAATQHALTEAVAAGSASARHAVVHFPSAAAPLGIPAGQYPATALPPQTGAYPPQPVPYAYPPHPQSAPLPPFGALPTAPGPYQATLGYPHGGKHQYPVTHEQPNVGAAARFSKLSSEASRAAVKGATKPQPPSHVPAVETHNTQLMEQMQAHQRQADVDMFKLNADLAAREAHRVQIEQELLQLRRVAAESQAQAQKARAELDHLLGTRAKDESSVRDAAVRADNLQQRYDFVCHELEVTKRELEAERRIPKYQPLSADALGGVFSTDPSAAANDFSSTAIAMENQSLKMQVLELQSYLAQRDEHLEQATKMNSSLMDENAKLSVDLRHEQQRHLVALSTAESHKVLVQDAQSEVEYLRLVVAEQKGCIDRMTSDHTERFERLRTEMEARQVREIHATQAIENAKALHVEAAKVHKSLLAEQGINEALQEEIQSLKRQLQDEREKNRMLLEQYEALRQRIRDTETTFTSQTTNLESLLNQWQHQQARQASEDRGQLQHASEILRTLKALELPYKNGQLVPPPRSEFVAPACVGGGAGEVPVDKAAPVERASSIAVSGTLHVSTSSPPPSSTVSSTLASLGMPTVVSSSQKKADEPPRFSSLQQEVQQAIAMEQALRRQAEASRLEALAALAQHHKSLETPSTSTS